MSARSHLDVVGVIACGGALGALARYGVGLLIPGHPDGFPLATFVINVSGCLLIGVLMELVSEVWAGRRLLRPFLGTGILGGFTTFSGYAVESQRLLAGGRVAVAALYLGGTLVVALLATVAGMAAAGAFVRARHRDRVREGDRHAADRTGVAADRDRR